MDQNFSLKKLEEMAMEAVLALHAEVLENPPTEGHYTEKRIIGIGATSTAFDDALQRFTGYLKTFNPDYVSPVSSEMTKDGKPKVWVVAYRNNADFVAA